jgi:cytochrome c oxidase subunit 3
MTAEVSQLPLTSRPRRGPPVVESEVLAMVIFVFTEVMLFAAFISAYTIISSGAEPGQWPPPTDPVVPAGPTAVASALLLLSGVAVFVAGRSADKARTWLGVAAALASGFVAYQVYEGFSLVREGLTLVSSAHGGFFYTIVGGHAIHAVVALGILLWANVRLGAGNLSAPLFRAIRIFWYFVVLLWPVLYTVVYL